MQMHVDGVAARDGVAAAAGRPAAVQRQLNASASHGGGVQQPAMRTSAQSDSHAVSGARSGCP